jgi:cytochrome c-type biogenesis protein CcmH
LRCFSRRGAQAIGPDELLTIRRRRPARGRSARSCAASSARARRSTTANAEIARDLRLLVRERITAGDSDAEVLDFLVDRYGEFVLFRPPMTAANAPLWLAGPVFLIFGIALITAIQRRRAREAAAPKRGLSPEEQARIDALLRE